MSTKERSPQELYRERVKRIEDAVALKVPDRVPLLLTATFFPAKYVGMSCQEAMYDYERLALAWKAFASDFQPDMFPNPFPATALGPLLDMLDFKQLRWPGHGISPDHSFQFVEGEYMKADEYDAFLDDPSDYMFRTYLPRVCGPLAGLKVLPYLGGMHYTWALIGMAAFALPEAVTALETMVKAGTEAQKMLSHATSFVEEMKATGFPTAWAANVNAPFDYIGNALRGTRGIMLDMYRNPDKLLLAMEKVLPALTSSAIAAARGHGIPRIFIPLHKGADGYMSREQFQTFYWPTLRRLMLALIEEGITPCPFFEGQYVSRLEIIGDIPPGKAMYKFDATDLVIAKKVLGDRVCLRGNVPASLLCAGTAQEVKDYCRRLIDVVGKGGGLILDGGMGIPDEAKAENVRAMVEFTREYGVYR